MRMQRLAVHMAAAAAVVAALAWSGDALAAGQAQPNGNAYGACNTQGQGRKVGHEKRCGPSTSALSPCEQACRDQNNQCVALSEGDADYLFYICNPELSSCLNECANNATQ